MSITPFHSDERPPQPKVPKPPKAGVNDPLTLSQALTITAGLAGLIGLISGVVIRFSLANSTNARFLSPLQTFPSLSDWSNEEMQSDIEQSVREPLNPETFGETDPFYDDPYADPALETRSTEALPDNFDSFSERTLSSDNEPLDPYERLRVGPQLGRQSEDTADFLSPSSRPETSAEEESTSSWSAPDFEEPASTDSWEPDWEADQSTSDTWQAPDSSSDYPYSDAPSPVEPENYLSESYADDGWDDSWTDDSSWAE